MTEGVPGLVPIARRSTSSLILDQLRERIVDGTFPAGSQVAEAQLAATFGISRGPVREALQRLIQEGLLVNIRNRGVFVVELGPIDVEDLFFSRRLIERQAAGLLWKSKDERHLARLRESAEDMAAVPAAEWSRLVERDLAFHESLVASADSPRLTRMFATLAAETRICLSNLPVREPRPDLLAEEHRGLVALLRDGGEASLLAALDSHLDSSLRRLTARD
ncbi:GntR family transcriptional regulator [Streptomyces sp. NBC_01803]|uniref:GntR family transcriptional regulator n=1 Tax=Streptomyces sp. NBC_01803 TaxID=2975946 RepID=UPI002DDA07A7|nr:GntR family transcriptional regulator [Streptomyces sp. NBC_01803]WSA43362.1 GntR family transcriptional regulator [Streptomyces sp. NBC_01803]